MKELSVIQQTVPLELGETIEREKIEHGSIKPIYYYIGAIKIQELADFEHHPKYLEAIEYSKKFKMIVVSNGYQGAFVPLGKHEITKRFKYMNALFYVDDNNIQLLGIDEVPELKKGKYNYHSLMIKLSKLEL